MIIESSKRYIRRVYACDILERFTCLDFWSNIKGSLQYIRKYVDRLMRLRRGANVTITIISNVQSVMFSRMNFVGASEMTQARHAVQRIIVDYHRADCRNAIQYLQCMIDINITELSSLRLYMPCSNKYLQKRRQIAWVLPVPFGTVQYR